MSRIEGHRTEDEWTTEESRDRNRDPSFKCVVSSRPRGRSDVTSSLVLTGREVVIDHSFGLLQKTPRFLKLSPSIH